MKKSIYILSCILLTIALTVSNKIVAQEGSSILKEVKHGYAQSGDVKIHYAEMGEGPLMVMIHGFPDYWYTWRHQMQLLSKEYHVVAMDLRGYNKSDKPEGVENYSMKKLVGDVIALIKHFQKDKAIIVAHDWGGAIAWQLAIHAPKMVDKLVILNVVHPNGMRRELTTNVEQQKSSAYARNFIESSPSNPKILFGKPMTAENLSYWVKDPLVRKEYIKAYKRSSFTAMLNYYKANYARPPYEKGWEEAQKNPLPKVQAPVLIFHGLEDWAINAKGLNNTWEWVEKDMTIVTVPGATHFVQQDAPDLVSETIKWWLKMRSKTNK